MTPTQIRSLVEAFGLSCDGLVSCTIEIKRSGVQATCVYERSGKSDTARADEVVRRFNLAAQLISVEHKRLSSPA